MGGFFSGLGSAVGGAGQSALEYGEGVRSRQLQQWGMMQQHAADLLRSAEESATSPERQTQLSSLRSKVLKLKPGQDPSKILQEIQDHVNIHPVTTSLMTPPQPQPKPGMAAPGSVPGVPQIQPLQAGSASMPATSPISPAQVSPSSAGGAPAPQGVAGGQTPQAPASNPAPVAPLPPAGAGPGGFADIIMGGYKHALDAGSMPPALKTAAQPFLTNEAELSRARQLKQFQLNEQAPAMLEFLKQNVPGWDNLPDFYKTSAIMSAAGMQAPGMMGMSSAMYTPLHFSGIRAEDFAQQYPEEFAASGIDPKTTPVLDVTIDKMTGRPKQIMAKGQNLHFITTEDGKVVGVNPTNPSIPPVQTGGVSPVMITPRNVGVDDQGHPLFSSMSEMQRGQFTRGAGVQPSFIPTVKTGQASIATVDAQDNPVTKRIPTVTSTQKGTGKPGGSALVSGAASNIPTIPAVGGEYRKFSDNQLTAAGQKDVSQIDDVLGQIRHLKQLMEQKKLHTDDTKNYYSDYFKYMHLGQSTPNQDLWTGLSFEGLRSAATALRGTNSRALPIISKAMEHVPNPSAGWKHLPDSPKVMYDKLKEMENILSIGRDTILADQKKSGLVKPVQPSSQPKPGGVVRWGRDAQGNPVRIP